MKNENFTTTISVDQTPDVVFAAINDVRAWWSGKFDGSTDSLGAEFTYQYQDLHRSTQKVTELVPGKKVVWRVTDSHLAFLDDKSEWTGTELVFEISQQKGKSELRFTHAGLVPQQECYGACSNAWSSLINANLRERITTNAPQPDALAEAGATLQKHRATPLYGIRDMAASMRAVRQNTILMAGDIPDDQFGFRATPATRSIGETLVHIAWLGGSDLLIHDELHLDSLEGFDFPGLLGKSATEEKQLRNKAEIIALLQSEGDRWVSWIEQRSDAFMLERVGLPGGGSVSRFEMILATKEHELQHRAQLTVLQRLIGIAPRFTGLA